MPELPEVEIITREIENRLVGDKIINYDVKWYKTLEIKTDHSLVGRVIKSLDRKGKYIIFTLDKGFLITHLRMTGNLIIKDENDFPQDHLRIIFHLASNRYLLFYDIRKL